MTEKNQVNEAKDQVVSVIDRFKQEITTPVPVSFTISKTVRIVALIAALYLTYSTVPHWFSYLSAGNFDFVGIFSPLKGAVGAVMARMFELLVLKTVLTIALYCVAFPRQTILKLQSKSDSE